MQVGNRVKEFLAGEGVQQLINNNMWREFYEELVSNVGDISYVGEFTQLLLTAGIDPLKHLTYIPEGYLSETDIQEFNIPPHMESIKTGAFEHCNLLTSITIPSKLIDIGGWVFFNCINLKAIEFQSHVECIGEYAFYKCSSLEKIDIPGSLTVISRYTFYGCTKLEGINFPNTIVSIESHAFQRCTSLKSISIPKTVSSIGRFTFGECSALKDIYYGGTEEEWNEIAKDEYWDYNTSNYTIHCTDGDIAVEK